MVVRLIRSFPLPTPQNPHGYHVVTLFPLPRESLRFIATVSPFPHQWLGDFRLRESLSSSPHRLKSVGNPRGIRGDTSIFSRLCTVEPPDPLPSTVGSPFSPQFSPRCKKISRGGSSPRNPHGFPIGGDPLKTPRRPFLCLPFLWHHFRQWPSPPIPHQRGNPLKSVGPPQKSVSPPPPPPTFQGLFLSHNRIFVFHPPGQTFEPSPANLSCPALTKFRDPH